MVACLMEMNKYDEALLLIQSVVYIFESEKVDLKVRARLLQRKGSIHLKRNELKLAVEAFEISIN